MKVLFALIFLASSQLVLAQIYMCEVDGNISYQEAPCESALNSPALGIQKSVIEPKYLNAKTTDAIYAQYYKSLVEKIEKTGNDNYPLLAKQQKLFGDVLVQFFLKPEGNVENVIIRESSGHDVLDKAAADIVNSASRFPRFPREITKETSELIVSVRLAFLKPHTVKCK